MTEKTIFSSINTMFALTLLLMVFTGDLVSPVIPAMMGHAAADFDGLGLADWAFPGFLFVLGMIVPFSIGKRISEGEDTLTIAKHILRNTVILLIIGVLMINSDRVNPELTGISKNLWTVFMYIGIFLVLFKYTENDRNFFTIIGLRLAGAAILVALIFKFKSGEFENNGSFILSWWGIVGIIGWAYLVSALIYLAIRNSIVSTIVALVFFLVLNILSQLDLLNSLNIAKPIFGVIIEGSIPLIVLAGLLTSLILKKYSNTSYSRTAITIASIGVLSLAAGYILRKWFIISYVQTTPSWALICSGISMLMFALLFFIIDIKKINGWTQFFKPVGENPFTTYLAVSFLYCLILTSGVPVLFYKQSGVTLVVIIGSVIWTLLIAGMSILLVRYRIKLDLLSESY
jgi:predicted acyltransferase